MTGQVIPFPSSRIVRHQWLTKKRLAAHYGRSVRWVELRVADGAPSELVDGQRLFSLTEFDAWLRSRTKEASS